MPKEDVTFGFDPMPFSKGIDKVIGKMGKMEDSAKNVARGISKGFNVKKLISTCT